ncbi:hypothetical protein F511_00424 [Dorcoceras hygrometricum]|nr:hypothetical protein F511_00424 [Dorcoceras hygrometricum]
MESILARALEYTLKYWLKSFSRDQFKLQGRSVQLSNLDINGDALHASIGLPPALNVTTAKVGKLEIILPSVSNVQIEPIVVQIDRLDLVLEENDDDIDASRGSSSASPISAAKGSGYGFADKIADGMTLEVRTVNLLLETHGGARQRGGATWASPMASITIRNLLLYTTNEHWEVVNLKEARDFSSDKKFIYVFKKLEWGHLSIDLLPHPDMFSDSKFSNSLDESNRKDADGAKRLFFGGERFIEGISGEAHITIQRTELNSPLGLEVQLHITEARSTEAAGRSLVSLIVDHIFLCIKDAEFRIELLMQSLFFSRASISDGENAKYLTRVMIGGLFLRDTFARTPCALVQPSMETTSVDGIHIPDFGKDFCPPIYPLGEQPWQLSCGVPLISLHCLQLLPPPTPPIFASRTVIDCQPLIIHLQEESCLRILSLLADGIVVNHGTVLPDFSIKSLVLNLKGLDVMVPLEIRKPEYSSGGCKTPFESSFTGARLHIQDMMFSESPSLKVRLLNLDRDPACFCLWKGQPVDASQRKYTASSSLICLALETDNSSIERGNSLLESLDLWRCLEMKDVCLEVAMVTADGSPLTNIPPPGGVVRVGVACQRYSSNSSVEELFFVLDLYAYFGRVFERIAQVGKNQKSNITRNDSLGGAMMEKVPGDTAVTLAVEELQLRFLESSSDTPGQTLVRFMGENLSIKVGHRTLGGARAISSTLQWDRVEVECAGNMNNLRHENVSNLISDLIPLNESEYNNLRAVFWVQKSTSPFMDIHMVHVIPYSAQDIECHSLSISACVAGVRLGGGMNYTESLLHRFGILGPDGGPGEDLTRGLEKLSTGPLSKLFKTSPLIMNGHGERMSSNSEDGKDSSLLQLGAPDDVELSIQLKDWLFALEDLQDMGSNRRSFCHSENSFREERSWHATFQSLHAKGKSSPKHVVVGNGKPSMKHRSPIESITVGMEGLQILKPVALQGIMSDGIPGKIILQNGLTEREKQTYGNRGVHLEVELMASEDGDAVESTARWMVESLKFSVKEPIEAVVTKDELQHLILLCKSEVDSMGRIAAGVLRILKLEGSIGSAAISQLSNLGSNNFDRIFTPEKLSGGSSPGNFGLSPSCNFTQGSCSSGRESTMASLKDSQSKCAALASDLIHRSDSSTEYADKVKELKQNLESMQKLLEQLRTQL